MYAVMCFAKLKTMGQIKALGKHNEREQETHNADEARRGDNVRLAGVRPPRSVEAVALGDGAQRGFVFC
jgi:hypothetical protein